jgi:nucleotide-binding universal stress UspA family protein
VNVTASLQHGPVVEALIGYAKRHRVDLIVMRSHARKGFARVWLGSVADRLIRDSGIPVVVVRPPSMATVLENGVQFKRILVPLDGSELAEQSIAPAATLAAMDDSKVVLVRVIPPSKRKVGVLESEIGAASAEDVESAKRYLENIRRSPSLRSRETVQRVVVSDDVPGTILHLADTEEADLIAIATRGRNALARATSGSVADRVMRESITSVLVLHPETTVLLPAEAPVMPKMSTATV